MSNEDTAITWRIHWNGKDYRWTDLKVSHLAVLRALVGDDDWATLNPWQLDPNTGYQMAAFLLTVFLIEERLEDITDEERAGDILAEVIQEMRNIRVADLADAVHDS